MRMRTDSAALAARHFRIGWWQLLVFLLLGIVLEGLHAVKAEFYLGVTSEGRRLLWTLAHVHGTLFSLIHLALACTFRLRPHRSVRLAAVASRCLTLGGMLMPSGFVLCGIAPYGGHQSPAAWVVRAGAVLVLVAVRSTAVGTGFSPVAARQKNPE